MHKLENKLKDLMLNYVEFKIDGKTIKKGKIKIFNTKQFFIKFKLENGDVYKDFELPYPYRVLRTDSGFLFDYCLSAFVSKTEESYWKMKTINSDNSTKFHEKYLMIVPLSA